MIAKEAIEQYLRNAREWRSIARITIDTGYAKSTVQSNLKTLKQDTGLMRSWQNGVSYYGYPLTDDSPSTV